MNPSVIYTTVFPALADTDTVRRATALMLEHRVCDLPVVDSAGTLLGMFRLDRLLAVMLPKAALMDYGMPDLAFAMETVGQLRERLAEVEDRPVREFVVKPEHVAHPQTSPLEIVLLLYKGANAIPVVEAGGSRLVGMITPRDLLTTLSARGSA
jgi:CBS domain-containing protein